MQSKRSMADALGTEKVDAPGTEPKAEVVALKPKAPRASTREGKKTATVFIDKSVHDQMRMLTIETDKSIQELQIEAWNLLFQSYNKPPIAQ